MSNTPFIPSTIWQDLDGDNLLHIAPAKPPKRGWLKVIGVILIALLLLAASASGYLYWRATQIVSQFQSGSKGIIVSQAKGELGVSPQHRLSSPKNNGYLITGADKTVGDEGGAKTILLIGSDRRWGEIGKGRSDTMLLLRILPNTHMLSVLSIPRDLRVPIPGHGEDKINAAFSYGGEKLLIATVREYFGVTIDHFVEVSFRGFGDIITSLGGVYLPVDQRYYVAPGSGYMAIDLQPGYQKLQRVNALSFVRFRHADSDFYRAARQQLFLREVTRQIMASKYNIPRVQSLIESFAKATTSDISSLNELWSLSDALRQTPAENIQRLTLPANNLILSGIDYLSLDDNTKTRVVNQWYHPEWIIKQQASLVRKNSPVKPKAAPTHPVTSNLAVDNQVGNLFSSLAGPGGLRTCTPALHPANYYWPQGSGRDYQLEGKAAAAIYETFGSGQSLLWMFSRWQNPPILDQPTETVEHGGRKLELFFENGSLRQVAFALPGTKVWLTNSLKNEISPHDMISLALSCH